MTYKEEAGRFAVYNDSAEEIGEVTFSTAGDSMYILDHTYVDDKYRGQGIASELVRNVVEKAKRENRQVVPLCPFARAEFRRKPEYQAIQAGRK